MLPCSAGENLRIYKSRIEHGIHSRYVFSHQAFQPTLRLRAIEGMACVGCQRVAIPRQIFEKLLQVLL